MLCIVFKILKTPGPGTYQAVDTMNVDGMYAKSSHMRTKTPSMRVKTTDRATKYDRVPAADEKKPGPGWYDHQKQSLSMSVLSKALPMTRTRQMSGFGSDSRKVFISKSSKLESYPSVVIF